MGVGDAGRETRPRNRAMLQAPKTPVIALMQLMNPSAENAPTQRRIPELGIVNLFILPRYRMLQSGSQAGVRHRGPLHGLKLLHNLLSELLSELAFAQAESPDR